MRNIEEIKQIIKELFRIRKKLKFRYKELANMFKVNIRTLSRWEDGNNIPNEVYLPMIKKFIELSKTKRLL